MSDEWVEILESNFTWDCSSPGPEQVVTEAKDDYFRHPNKLVEKMNDAPPNSCPTGYRKWKWVRESLESYGF